MVMSGRTRPLILLMLVACVAAAQNTPARGDAADGWILLFDGKTVHLGNATIQKNQLYSGTSCPRS
jgi:hypothetical protein